MHPHSLHDISLELIRLYMCICPPSAAVSGSTVMMQPRFAGLPSSLGLAATTAAATSPSMQSTNLSDDTVRELVENLSRNPQTEDAFKSLFPSPILSGPSGSFKPLDPLTLISLSALGLKGVSNSCSPTLLIIAHEG